MTALPKSSPRQVESAEDLCISRADASSVSPCHTCRWRHRRAGRLFSCTVALKPETTVAYLDGELDMSTAVSHDPFGPLAKAGSDIIVNLSGVRYMGSAGQTRTARTSAGCYRGGRIGKPDRRA